MALSLFQWLAATNVGVALRDSTGGFAIVETVYLITLAILGGAIFAVGFRLLGVGLRKQTVSEVATELWPYFLGA